MDFPHFAFDKVAVRPVKRILDVACGYGRHAVPLAKDGFSLVAIDSNPAMIKLAKKRALEARIRIEFKLGNMRDLKFSEGFDAVIPIYCLDYLLEDEDLLVALKGIYGVLLEGGILVAVLNNPYHTLKGSAERGSEVIENKGVMILDVWSRELDALTGTVNLKELIAVRDGDRDRIYGPYSDVFRLYDYGQLRRFLSDAGFRDVRCFGSFEDREEAKPRAKKLVLVARKAKEVATA